jgi:hypothetical protein
LLPQLAAMAGETKATRMTAALPHMPVRMEREDRLR